MRVALLPLLLAGWLPAQVADEFALPPAPAAPDPGGWRVQVGAMALALPNSPGSGEGRVVPWPVVSAAYGDRLLLGASRIGVGAGAALHLVRVRGFRWDAGLGIGERRREARADELAGMGDREASLWAGTALRARAGIFGASLSWAAGLGSGAGTRSTLSVGLGGRLEARWFGSLALSASWADARQMAYEFGVNASQAAERARLRAAGDPRLRPGEAVPYEPQAGLRDRAATALLAYAPAPRWRVFALLRVETLGDAAATSPLVRKPTGTTFGIGFSCAL